MTCQLLVLALGDGDATNDKLRTVSGDLTIANVVGGLDLSLLKVDDITVPGGVTSLKMGSVKANSLKSAGEATGHLNLSRATVIDGGKSKVSSITAPKATDIDITTAATLTVLAVKAATIDVGGTTVNGAINVTATDTTVVKFPDLTTLGVGEISTGKLAELHLPKLSSTNTMTSAAKVMDLSALATQADGGGSPITLSAITNFNAPKLDISGVVSVVAATDITVSDISTITGTAAQPGAIYALAAKNLTISALSRTKV